ncbi:hypothetical protein [Pararhizobium mangrovi]|uniref:Uncharacterized protein n=1 Tax=Pararhizobium mangrovi TaxID=2590452 RepID=A0A506U796_9HYPH|nr:hypothetical protein [Pararhizobium mangrovi]TPW27767.1 hypothetical protein FJU11_11060 [Pararhizobium mangrovi]
MSQPGERETGERGMMRHGPRERGHGRMGPDAHGRMGPGAHKRADPGMRGMGGMHRHDMRSAHFQMKLAGKLAAVETAIGVRSDQLDAWRAFTSALVDFVGPPDFGDMAGDTDNGPGGPGPDMTDGSNSGPMDAGPQGGPGQVDPNAGNPQGDATPPAAPGPKDQAGPGPQEQGSQEAQNGGPDSGFGPLDRIVENSIERGQEAQKLRDAMDTLQSTLDPDQLAEARMLMAAEMQRARMHHGRHHGWHHDRDFGAGPGMRGHGPREGGPGWKGAHGPMGGPGPQGGPAQMPPHGPGKP